MSIMEAQGVVEAKHRPIVSAGQTIGVTQNIHTKRWEAHLWIRGKQIGKPGKGGIQIYLGCFNNMKSAQFAHDKVALKCDVGIRREGDQYPLNYDQKIYEEEMEQHFDWSIRDYIWKIKRDSAAFTKGKSRFKGVSSRKAGVFDARISHTDREGVKKEFPLGRFHSEVEAAKQYDLALLFIKSDEAITNFRPSEYTDLEIQKVGQTYINGPLTKKGKEKEREEKIENKKAWIYNPGSCADCPDGSISLKQKRFCRNARNLVPVSR